MTQLEITLSQEDKESIAKLHKAVAEIKTQLQPKEPPKYYSGKELAALFQVDASTIFNWRKRKIIVAHQIGGRVYYMRDEIEKALVKLNN